MLLYLPRQRESAASRTGALLCAGCLLSLARMPPTFTGRTLPVTVRFASPLESGQRSTVDQCLLLLGVARPGDLVGAERGVERRHVPGTERHVRSAHVFLEVAPPLRPGNRHDVRPFVQQPSERDLTRGHARARRQLANGLRRLHIGVEVRALVARIVAPVVALGILLGALDGAGEEAAAERRERDEPDAELAQQRDDARLEIALPQRVLALEDRDRMHGLGAPDRALAGLGEAEEADLARAHQVGHGAGDVLDR